MEQKEQFSWGGIEPLCVVRRVLRQLPAIIAGGVIAVLCAWMAMTGLYHPSYTASTTLAVSVKSSSYSSVLSNLSMSAEIAETFTTLFESNVFDNLAAEMMGGTLPARRAVRRGNPGDQPAGAYRDGGSAGHCLPHPETGAGEL